jgi:dienelactone hydrolase
MKKHSRKQIRLIITVVAVMMLLIVTGSILLERFYAPSPLGKGAIEPLVSNMNVTISGQQIYPVTIYYPTNDTGKRFPLVVFCVGSYGLEDQYTNITIGVASKGYVVMAFSFNTSIPFDSYLAREMDAINQCITYAFQPSFALASILQNKVALIGHSYGGASVLSATAVDSRVLATVALAPFTRTPTLNATPYIKAPTLIITGSNDTVCPPSEGYSYYNLLTCNKEYITFDNASHPLGIFNATGNPTGPDQPQFSPLTRKYTVAWLDYWLKQSQSAYSILFGAGIKLDNSTGIVKAYYYALAGSPAETSGIDTFQAPAIAIQASSSSLTQQLILVPEKQE